MESILTTKIFNGELILPNENAFSVEYWQHYHKYLFEEETVKDCIAFLHWGSDAGDLSYRDCRLLNKNNEVVMTYEQLVKAIDNYEKEMQND